MKIGTLNLCLGLKNKKLLVSGLLKQEKIDICCLQEVDLERDYDPELLSFPGYIFEVEKNDIKSRSGIYISNTITYKRRTDLEGLNSHLVIIDIEGVKPYRIINLYRCFTPQEGIPAREKFNIQLDLINIALTRNTILLGDFNLDYSKRYDETYQQRLLFSDFDDKLAHHNLIQTIDFPTWGRIITGTYKSSILDHVYIQDPTDLSSITHLNPPFGDHVLISFVINGVKNPSIPTLKRDWRTYTKELLCAKLAAVNWSIEIDSVQANWNKLENMLINIIDEIVPMRGFVNNTVKNNPPPPHIRNKLNVRKRLLKKQRTLPSIELKKRIKNLNAEIRSHFHSQKKLSVRRGISPGDTKSLWKAVKIAKDQNVNELPNQMFHQNVKIDNKCLPETFAAFFENKVETIISQTEINDEVYNGIKKVTANNKMFMSKQEIIRCISSIKPKNSEGFDRIPQRILLDGIDHLLNPLSELFTLIYKFKEIPEQWLISKVIPIHKKQSKSDITNYRPIANLCSTSKIFERLILNRILDIETENKIDITGKQQHGFKKDRSTSTASLVLQSLISRAIDDDNYVLMASLDLSAAFDIVNVKLLLKRLIVIGLPPDVVTLISVWLSKRYYFVTVGNSNSRIYVSLSGIVQGSILGPILYAIYVSPLFDICNLTNFADDNFVLEWHKNKVEVVNAMESKLKVITKWLRDSGLKVNESKTELCHFYKADTHPLKIKLDNVELTSSTQMNVLGITFDSRLQWSFQVSNTIKKANATLNAIKLIRRYFTTKELLALLTSNFYSILYYNSEVWHTESMKATLKQQILSTSARALKICMYFPDPMISFQRIHQMNNRALPEQMMAYKHALLLFKLYNSKIPSLEWMYLNFQQTLTSRQSLFKTMKNNKLRVGNNALANRLTLVNNKIPLNWLNLSVNSFKINCKKIFL